MKYIYSIIFLLLIHISALGDTWLPPKEIKYYNADSTYYVQIIPTVIPEKYYRWLNASPKKKRKFSAADTTIVPCHAKMYKRTNIGDSLIWEQKLINRIAPVSAIVSANGEYMITFNNWHRMGYGVDVMVIYDAKGMLLKRHMLEDISPFPINTYDMSISSIWWNCGERFIDNQTVEICFKDENKEKAIRVYNLKDLKIENVP